MARFYVTTAIFYPNAVPHLGTAYEVIGTDAIARWRRLRGDEVFFLSGNDEHALKVAQVAAERGQTPLAYCDEMAASFDRAWRALGIGYDEYIRTSQRRHHETVAWFLDRIRAADKVRVSRGEQPVLFKGTYEGLYCVGCEAFLREKDLVNGLCPNHPNRTPQRLVEENWFFRLSAFGDRLKRWYSENPDWLRPEAKRNEMAGLLEEGLQDISVSRPRKSIQWGIPFPGDADHVVYVWFEALMNYVTGARLDEAGRARADEDGRSPGLWPADLHVVGKDIVRFHAIIWPAMLWAADLALPRSVFVHGFVQVGGAKMSKSGGGTVSPLEIAGLHGADALRYFLLREIAWGADGEFSLDRFKERTESDLANTVGNLLHRTLTMVEKYFDGVVPERSDNDYAPEGGEIHAVGALEVLVAARRDQAARAFDEQDFAWALEQTVDIARQANVRIDSVAPWRLMKAPGDEGRRVVADLLNVVVEGLKDVAVLLSPVLPGKSREMWRQLGLDEADLEALRIGIPGEGHKDVANLEELHPEKWFEAVDAVEVAGRRVRKGDPLFPRDDAKDPAGG